MAKHFSQFFFVGHSSIESSIEWWNEVAKTREMLPMLPSNSSNNGGDMATLKRPVELKAINASAYDDYGSVKSFIRKSQSHHGSFIDVDANETSYPTLTRPPRAMSEHSLVSSQSHARMSNFNNNNNNNNNDNNAIVTAIFDFMSSAENQLTFQEGDKIQIIGEKIQGWQFGENLRSNQFGW
jgi:hypothetical protein